MKKSFARPSLIIAFLFAGLSVSLAAPAQPAQDTTLETQREHYLEARDALSRRQMERYRQLRADLDGYPLAPYLDYRELTRSLAHADPDAIRGFLERESGSYLAHQLQRQWLHSLARREQWSDYLAAWPGDLRDTELQCHALRARLARDDRSALEEVAPLWNVGRSQPEACDPVFEAWMADDRLTPELAWSRHTKAVEAHRLALADYIAGLMPDSQQDRARLMRRVHRRPDLLTQPHRFREQSEPMQAIIAHGIRRLARQDAAFALELWHGYDAQQLFSDRERLATQEVLAHRLIHQGHRQLADRLLARVPALNTTELVETQIRQALGQLDWERAYTWLEQLPPEARESDRWRYWRARMIETLELEETGPRPEDLYNAVAGQRNFYGFLSADKLGYDYRLLHQPAPVSEEQLRATAALPVMKRARELLMVGENLNANREWYFSVRSLSRDQILAAGKLAQSWGWHRKGIQAMANGRFWDDLQVRFPLAYREHVQSAAEATAIQPPLLFAIARQESAFMPDARSPAGALGLMQLMPATARQTARKAGVHYRRADLLTPEKNIVLGSRYLSELLAEFEGNRILATAAYNAGPYRVKQWLSRQPQKLPYDVWIETIPFRETRGYVQKVLSYSVIYSHRMGERSAFITPEEASKPL